MVRVARKKVEIQNKKKFSKSTSRKASTAQATLIAIAGISHTFCTPCIELQKFDQVQGYC